jgi:two-component system CheB/CheR fusion protein
MLSHELRNPLGAMTGATELLKRGDLTPQRAARLFDVLSRQSQQMSRLLDDLLEVSRVTQDKIELRRHCQDIRQVVREAAEVGREQLELHQVSLTVDIDEEPLLVEADAARLQQILANLLNNAAKYTPPGGHVALSARRDGKQVVLSVKDDGMGIPPQMIEDVFELFVQSPRTLDRSEGGLGVGLTLVRGLVERHGGQVSAHSDGEGQGAEFVVRLPSAQGHPASTPPPEAKDMLNQDNPKLEIVVVEDNDDSRMMMCELLELSGFHCHTAATGPLGLELVKEHRPDVALIDIGLPELDGLEVARLLRQDARNDQVFLVALTGYGQREDRDAAHRAGFDAHLVKPVDFTALLALLRSHHAKRIAERASLDDGIGAT